MNISISIDGVKTEYFETTDGCSKAVESLHKDICEKEQEVWDEIQKLLYQKDKIGAVKTLRSEFNIGIADAKYLIEIFAKFLDVTEPRGVKDEGRF